MKCVAKASAIRPDRYGLDNFEMVLHRFCGPDSLTRLASALMYEISFFRKKEDPFSFAVTRDKTGSMLPSPHEWQHWFSQQAYPELALEGGALRRFEAGFRERGYYLYPRCR